MDRCERVIHKTGQAYSYLQGHLNVWFDTSAKIRAANQVTNKWFMFVCLFFLYHTHPCFRIWQTLVKYFLPPAGCISIFPTKSCQDAWRGSGWQEIRWMVDEAKLHSLIHSSYEAMRSGYCHGEELDPICWPVPAAVIAVLGASLRFAEHTTQS